MHSILPRGHDPAGFAFAGALLGFGYRSRPAARRNGLFVGVPMAVVQEEEAAAQTQLELGQAVAEADGVVFAGAAAIDAAGVEMIRKCCMIDKSGQTMSDSVAVMSGFS